MYQLVDIARALDAPPPHIVAHEKEKNADVERALLDEEEVPLPASPAQDKTGAWDWDAPEARTADANANDEEVNVEEDECAAEQRALAYARAEDLFADPVPVPLSVPRSVAAVTLSLMRPLAACVFPVSARPADAEGSVGARGRAVVGRTSRISVVRRPFGARYPGVNAPWASQFRQCMRSVKLQWRRNAAISRNRYVNSSSLAP